MLIGRYSSDDQFTEATKNTPTIIKLGFVRDNLEGLTNPISEIVSETSSSIKDSVLRSLPILGSILGCARLYSTLSTNDPLDETQEKIWHTIFGALETLGLGILILLFKIIFVILHCIFHLVIGFCK
ncbi:hypothetical protein CpB0228 [Chlamydia pneumoniae TW-183]|uniref:Uncharacterized protein n=2 Tax=Chlamydia pneumoniae TaxID=83558 RepID=Q9Z8W1_CHLPN|nr:hypothetical protein [Chlamydia pneumoniae]AAD18376.1 hypothetical protein CPn_0223 [Chlamydia pneumoniae CWL029]AAF38364.1 hypothetical protein CP_0542 [Chlamydia pneumoniae AR39]AAP98161.1 hypothetical protein CpB0228 [Chlamydia pneumoniae TW-183]CRI32720.1 Uncharacterized protein BN1224_Wien1_A_02270 [Chlamydia pneumoniae]CRI35583.1 Uncharacterized protein BN1224_CM1_A_02300 [Chlamydia pneumoniae]